MQEQRFETWLKHNGITTDAHLLFYKRAAKEFDQEAMTTQSKVNAALVARHVANRRASGLDAKKAGFLSQAGEVYVRYLTELETAAKVNAANTKTPSDASAESAKPSIKKTTSILPATITLKQRSNPDFPQKDAAEVLIADFAAAGFDDIGLYSVAGIPTYTLHLVVHESDQLLGVVIAHESTGVWLNVIGKWEDGSAFIVSTGEPSGLPSRPGLTRLGTANASLAQALTELKAKLGRKPRLPLSVKNAVLVIEQGYADEMAFRAEQNLQADEAKAFA